MNLLCLQHVEFEGPAAIYEWANSRGHGLEILRMNSGGTMPALKEWDGLIVLGGPTSVQTMSPPSLDAHRKGLSATSCERRQASAGHLPRCTTPGRGVGWRGPPGSQPRNRLVSDHVDEGGSAFALVAGFPPTILAFIGMGKCFPFPRTRLPWLRVLPVPTKAFGIHPTCLRCNSILRQRPRVSEACFTIAHTISSPVHGARPPTKWRLGSIIAR